MQSEGIHTIFVDPKAEIKGLGRIARHLWRPRASFQRRRTSYPHTGSERRPSGSAEQIDGTRLHRKQTRFKRIRRVIAIDEIQTFAGSNDAIEHLYLVGAGKASSVRDDSAAQLMSETVGAAENKIIFRIDDRPTPQEQKSRALCRAYRFSCRQNTNTGTTTRREWDVE